MQFRMAPHQNKKGKHESNLAARNGGGRIHVRILSLSIVQMPEPYLLTQTQYKSRPSMAGILPYEETCLNCAPQDENADRLYALYTVG